MRGVGHLVAGHQGQVQKQGQHRHRRDEGGNGRGLVLDRGGLVDGGIDAHRLDQLTAADLDPVDAVLRACRVALQRQQIPCPQMQLRRRQGQTQAVAGQTRLGQPAFGDLSAFGAGQQQRDFRGGDGMGRLVRQDRLFGDGGIVGIGAQEAQADAACHLGLGRAAVLRMGRAVGQIGKGVGRDGLRHAVAAHDEVQPPVAFDRVEAIGQHQGLQGGAGVGHLREHIAAHDPVQLAGVLIRDAGAGADFIHDRGQRAGGEPPRHPMAARVIRGIRPERRVGREERIGPRVPGPDEGARHVQHRCAVERRDRVVFRRAPVAEHGAQVLHLDHLVLLAVGVSGARMIPRISGRGTRWAGWSPCPPPDSPVRRPRPRRTAGRAGIPARVRKRPARSRRSARSASAVSHAIAGGDRGANRRGSRFRRRP